MIKRASAIFIVLVMLINLLLPSISAATDDVLQSEKYNILDEKGYIARIVPETTVEEFCQKFNIESNRIHIYEGEEEITQGYIKTGMKATFEGFEEEYELSVIGDIDRDGLMDQIDLNLLIKHVIGFKEGQINGLEAISADLSDDGEINQVDITTLIRYIVEHELYIPEIKRPLEPSVEVIRGEQGESEWYTSEVSVKIKANENTPVPAARTIYKITGDASLEKEISEEEILELNEEGEYKITAYSYSEQGARTSVVTKRIKIDKTHPTTIAPTVTKETNKIIVTSRQTDALSGIGRVQYQIKKDNETEWGELQDSNEFTNLEEDVTYDIRTYAVDKAGNRQYSDIYSITNKKQENRISVTTPQTWVDEFATTEKTKEIVAAEDAQGNVRYAIQSQTDKDGVAVTYFSLSGRTLTRAANTPVNKSDYTVVIRATAEGNDSYNSGYKDITVKVTVNKQTVRPVTNLEVGTDGKVTWTASSNATGYEISIDNSNWTNVTSGIDYLSRIIAETGSRTVYVRAINSDTSNYVTPSSNARKEVTVYSVSLTKGTGISEITGAGNYINGATVTLGATTSPGYTWSKWTQTSEETDVSTTNAYSSTISENWEYTANATLSGLTFNGGTLLAGTYGTAYTSEAFAPASNGSGNYTYVIKRGAPAEASLDEANRKISFTHTTPAGTYNVVVTATDTTTGETIDATFVIVINKKQSTTNVRITGTNAYGQKLKAEYTTDGEGEVSYQWYKDSISEDNKISGATSQEYTIETGLVGKKIYVEVTVADGANYKGSTASDVTDSENNGQEEVDAIKITPPSATNKTYTGISQTSFSAGEGYTVEDNTGIDAEEYEGKAILTDKINTVWADTNNIADKTLNWTINKYNLSNAIIETVGTQEHTGNEITPEPAVTVPIPSGSTTTLVKNTHFTYGYSNNIVKGTATITITAKDNTNYTGSKSTTFTIGERPVQATGTNYSGTYDGNAHKIAVTVTEPTSETTVYYSTSTELTESNYESAGSTTNPTRTDATAELTGGKQTVYWYVHTTNTNYSDTKGSNTITINRVNGSGSVTMEGWAYGETAKNPVPTSSTNGTSNVTYKYKVSTAADSTYIGTRPSAPGTYTVQATFAATTNYNAVTATANFTINPKVTFKANGGTGTMNAQNVSYNENTALTQNVFTKTGYTFKGWATSQANANAGTVAYNDKANIKITSNITIYAVWGVNTYTIVYNLNDGTAGTNAPTSGTYNADVQISNPERTGYTFTGWTATGLGPNAKSGTAVSPSETWNGGLTTDTYFKNLTNTNGETVTFTANWMENNYQNTSTSTYYDTLAEALESVANNQTIKVLNSKTETTVPTLASGKTGVALDLNEKTVTLKGVALTNNGTLTIKGSGELTGSTAHTVDNYGTFTKSGTSTISNTCSSDSYSTVVNHTYGTVNISNGTVSSTNGRALVNVGIANITGSTTRISSVNHGTVENNAQMTISGATISTTSAAGGLTQGDTTYTYNMYKAAISNWSTGTLTINSGNIRASNQCSIWNHGKARINGGTISTTSGNAIHTVNNETGVTITGGTISSQSGIGIFIATPGANVQGNSLLTIIGGTIKSTSNSAIWIDVRGRLTIYGSSTITNDATNYATIENKGTAEIIGGTISSTRQSAIRINQGGRLMVSDTASRSPTITNDATNYATIENQGTVEITGGTISSTRQSAIRINQEGRLMVSDTASRSPTITNDATNYATIENQGTTEITGGTISSTMQSAIRIKQGGKLMVSDTASRSPTITNDATNYAAIENQGITEITGGTIKGFKQTGIRNREILILGRDDYSLSITSPSIEGLIRGIDTEGTFYFYDGIIKGGRAIRGSVTRIPSQYQVKTTTKNEVQTAILSR